MWDGGVAQLVECRAGTLLTKVRFPGASRDFSPRAAVNADSLRLPVQPLCAIACINICAYVKDPKHWQPAIVWTQENTAGTVSNGQRWS